MQGQQMPDDTPENVPPVGPVQEEYLEEVYLEKTPPTVEKQEMDDFETSLELVPIPEEQWQQSSRDSSLDSHTPSVIQLEENDLDYTENLFSAVILKGSENSELIKFMARKLKKSEDDENKIEGERIHFTETGEKFITRNGLRIYLKPIPEPHEVQAKNLSAVETYMVGIFFILILIIALVCSELLYVEFGKVGYIPFGVIALSIIHGATFLNCRNDKRSGVPVTIRRRNTIESTEEFMD